MEQINIGYDVIAEEHGEISMHIIGTGMFPITKAKFESEDFFGDMHRMFSGFTHLEMRTYCDKYDADNSMRGYLREIVLYPSIREDMWNESLATLGAITMHIHINGSKCSIVGFANITDIEYDGEFGDEKFLKSIANAVKSKYVENVDKDIQQSKKHNVKYQKYARNHNIHNVSYDFAYEMPQLNNGNLTASGMEKLAELLA